MRSSRRAKLAAGIVFALYAGVVIAGMAWATDASLKLAEDNVTEDHDNKIEHAVRKMGGYMAGIINTEAYRHYTDYRMFLRRIPHSALDEIGEEVSGVARVVLPSELGESGPPADWMDLHFSVDAEGTITSPHPPDESGPNVDPEGLPRFADERRSRQTWDWLQTVLPKVNLHERIEQACAAEHDLGSPFSELQPPEPAPVTSSLEEDPEDCPIPADRGLWQRQQSYRETQRGYLPRDDCLEADLIQQTLERRPSEAGDDPEDGTEAASEKVLVTVHPFTAFWLGEGPNGHQKLAFVREVGLDADLIYQGFIGDWSQLKPVLLKQIQQSFPIADLVPVLPDDDISVNPNEHMSNLPIRLQVPGVAGGAAAAAWREVRGTLITMWAVSAAVLVIAGIGLRNLVALTERRMQFAYAVTHELRTPLTTFRLYSDMLSAGLAPEAAKQEYLDTLNRESIRLSSLVEGVLEYARLENQRINLNTTVTNASDLLHGIRENVEKRCADNDVEARLENTLTNGQPLRTDVDVVNRIAGVLVNNACRHARGREGAAVLVKLGGENDHVFLDVADSGPGVERADARAIFKPFRRGRGADKAAQGGIGLGLALAKSWAMLLGGRLELAARHHPELGGAHFRLTFPAQTDA